jgi:hypothetical protein
MRWIDGFALALWGWSSALMFAPGCGDSVDVLCERSCDCVGCSEAERDECSTTFDRQEKFADDRGCGEPYADYLACLEAELECKDGTLDTTVCSAELVEYGDCVEASPSSG